MKIAVLPIYFNDAARLTAHTPDQIAAYCGRVDQYMKDQSGGRANLEYRVFDWCMLPITGTQFEALQFNAGDTVKPLFQSAMQVDLSAFEHFVLLIDKADARAAAWVPNDPLFRYLHLSAIDLSAALLAHEIGHLAGAAHGFLKTPWRDVAYGDNFCVMGGEDNKYTFPDAQLGASGPGMSGAMLYTCGWIEFEQSAASIDLAMGSRAAATVKLAALKGAPVPGEQSGPVLAWSDGLVEGSRLLLEYRAKSGWDAGLPAAGASPGWIVAHLTNHARPLASSLEIGAIGARAGATLELPDASVTLTVAAVDAVLNLVTLGVTRRITHLFAGGDGVIYAINDAGDLFWYRHDGHDDGSFRWTDANARKVSTGWRFKHVFAAAGGVIYAIDEAGDLFWYRHDGRDDGSARWADLNGRKVGAGWNVKRVFAGDGGVIYVINSANELLWFRHDGRDDGSFRWADNDARKVGDGWNVKQVFAGANGVIYAINDANDLLWFRHDGRDDGSFRWTDNNARKVGVGWNMEHVFAGDGGVIYAVDAANDLLWFRHDGRDDGSFRWTDSNARKVGIGWNFKAPSEPAVGVIYTVDQTGQLLWFRHDGNRDGSFRWRTDAASVVGAGWNLKHVFSSDDGVIYGINDIGDLTWYRHDGQVNGSFNWTDAAKLPDGTIGKAGIGWNFKHVFAGGEGIIYAIDMSGNLLWFRHEGRKDGSFRWTDNHARKIGIGWNFKFVFGGRDGVIYAVDDANDLLWFRHDGRDDGSFRWTDNEARKVGVGWNFKRVFAGRDGVIYAVNDANDLLWFRHYGHDDGSFRWADDKARKVGVGWDFGTFFAG